MPYPQPTGYYAQSPTLEAMQERYGATFDRMTKRDKSALLMALAESLHMTSDGDSTENIAVILYNWDFEPDDPELPSLLNQLDPELTEELMIELIRALAEQMAAKRYMQPAYLEG